MSDLEIRIVTLDPLRVASAYGFGASPEGIAFKKIETFAATNHLLEEDKLPSTFGFNNPDPSPGSPNYGYEVWLPIAEDVQAQGDISIKNVSGGLYAVTRLTGVQNIGDVWKQLAQWRESSKYRNGNHQWLEHLLSPLDSSIEAYVFDLYLPIAE
jgi:DNA gyrase inhibitor GyrI